MEVKENKYLKKLIIFFIVLLLLMAIIPIPYFVEMPGSSENIRDHVTVNEKRDSYDGSFMLTTVAVQQATVATLIRGYFDPNNDLISKEEMMGTSSDMEYEEMQRYHMETSQNFAIKNALDLANKPYKMEYMGVYVMEMDEHSNFNHLLEVGDTIYAVDDKKLNSSNDLIQYVQNKKPGDKITLDYIRDNKKKQTSAKLIKLTGSKKAGIGISLVDHTEIKSKEKIKFQTEDIGGPSAGLMFTLELYGLLTDNDLRQGKEVAGTGTIDQEGVVGRIGGIDKKVIAADQEGAELFFAPDDDIDKETKKEFPEIQSNYQEALESVKKNNLDIKVIPVKTVKDAIEYLEKEK
ncbi:MULTISPECIES: SepM family pheromone-processing serine protease [Vagococcus]|uniref:endopeptidase La n=1 Tax=Vagococcus fluvialis bH819 TaxID=1255619 RepID=A0A1X6WQW6_9ENTE|nr:MULTISPECIES: SepM family pheromone-processing serine protease [Vagococcus]SLM86694.1 Lon-like protease with PDZ domain [Vagococcus fluvialis bH819]HCM90902.1 PDZ domain-containing protein [Vagococcus sp.]